MRWDMDVPPAAIVGMVAGLVTILAVAGQLSNAGRAVAGAGAIVAIAGGIAWRHRRRGRRRLALLRKYGDPAVVECIMSRTVWKGETAEQLLESVGKPAAVDEETLRSARRQVWKYRRIGRHRYGQRVILDDGVVVGWRTKG